MRVRSSTIVLIFVVVVLAAIIVWGVSRKAAPPEVPFARTSRETIVSTIPTNGKVEPIEWATARAGRAGAVQKIFVHRGQTVRAGDPLVALDTSQVAASVAAAGARVKEAQAQQTVIREGGRAADVAEIDGSLARAQLDLETAQRDSDALQRLEARQAATRKEVQDAQERVKQAQLQIQSLQRRRAALVTQPDRTAAEARVHEAQASEEIARNNLALSVVRAPVPGTVYQFDLTLGAFLQVGDLVANIGRLDRVRVKVYVDEPDLGRMGIGMPVTITWDALPGRRWKGVVDRLPTEVAPLGTRQVGEVGCAIDNPDHDLVPGTNVNAEIQSKVVENAPLITHFNLFRTAEINGVAGAGYSSGQAIAALRDVAAQVLPSGYGYEFSGLTREEINAGNSTATIFTLSIVFVFLFLTALYESWSVPFAVLLAVPLGAFGAILTLTLIPSLSDNVYAQLGLVALLGLAAKNAILIVEFAKVRVDRGVSILSSTIEAVTLRLRPILMTSLAFIFGVSPLAFATGAGAQARSTIGWTVLGGMLSATMLAIFAVPVLFVTISRIANRKDD